MDIIVAPHAIGVPSHYTDNFTTHLGEPVMVCGRHFLWPSLSNPSDGFDVLCQSVDTHT